MRVRHFKSAPLLLLTMILFFESLSGCADVKRVREKESEEAIEEITEEIHDIGREVKGRLFWRFRTRGEVRTTPAIFSGVVYVTSTDGLLYALDSKTGEMLWKYSADSPIESSPVVEAGLVFFGGKDGKFHAVNVENRKAKWVFRADGAVKSSAAVEAGALYFGSDSGYVYGLKSRKGDLKWKFRADGPVISQPFIYFDTVFVGSLDGNLYAIDKNTGELVWKYATGGPVSSRPFVQLGKVFFGSADGKLYQLNAQTGAPVSTYDTGAEVFTPVGTSKIVYFGNSHGDFYALAIGSEFELWTLKTGEKRIAVSRIVGYNIYLGTPDGKIRAIDRRSGSIKWQFEAEGEVLSEPRIFAGVLYLGSTRGYVYALR